MSCATRSIATFLSVKILPGSPVTHIPGPVVYKRHAVSGRYSSSTVKSIGKQTYIFYTEINFCFDGVFDKFTTFFNDRPPSVIGLIRRVSMFEEIILGRDKNKDDLRFWKWLCDLLRSRVQIKHMVLYLEGDVPTVTEAENGTTCEAECMEQLATITGLEKLDILSFDGTRSIKWAGLQAYLDSKMLRHHEESVS